MQVTDKVMEILKADEKANKMMELFERKAQADGLKGKEYLEARKTMLMLIIANTPQALESLADDLYEEINA